MKQKQSLLWLMSLLMLAIAPVFTSCSSDDDDKSDPNVIIAGENDPLGKPIGLVYTDFLTANDVIHNADTTELTISKALADKKGITNFVNHPMGIWDKKEHRAYLRRATEQRLVDDHYVLKVVRSSVAEVTKGQEMALNTGIYYNPTRMVSRGGLTRASQGDPEADKYIDDNNVIHPAAITVQRKVDDGSNGGKSRMTRGDGDDSNSATFTIEELFTTPPSGANGWFDWLEDVWDKIVEATSYDWNDNYDITLLHTKSTISKDIKFNAGPEKGDTISLRFRCPIEFDLDYTLNIRSHGSIETAFVPIPSYLETYIDGYFEANPQLRIGFSKTITLPEDKQRIKLFSFSGVGFTFMIGPVPLTIDLDPSVYLKFTSTLKGDAYFGVQYDIATKFKAGVKYDGSWKGIAEGEKIKDEFSFINPKVSLEYTGGVGLLFGVDVIIEKVAGPSFNVGPQVKVNAKLSYQIGDDYINASIEGKAGIGGEAGAKIKIFGFEVAEWKTYFDIGPQWTIFKYPDDGSGSSGNYDPNNGGGGNDHYYGGRSFKVTDYTKSIDGKEPSNLFIANCTDIWSSYDYWRSVSPVSGENCWFVEFQARPAMKPTSYTLWTTNMTGVDWIYYARIPSIWALYGKKTSSSQWERIDYRYAQELPHDGYRARSFEISNPQEYEFFRFEVHSRWDGNTGNVMELGQLVLNE